MNKKIGGHISSSGGVLKVFDRAKAIGANCFQIFISSPRMWKVNDIDPKIAKTFREQLQKNDMNPSYIHIKYLVNLVSPKKETIEKSIKCIIEELTVANKLGLRGGMFHIGAHQGKDRSEAIEMLVEKCNQVLTKIPKNILLLLENSATDKKLGALLEEIGIVLKKINHPQVKVCLDTAHAFSSGYDLRTKKGVNNFVNEIEQYIGIENLEVLHINDSKAGFDSNIDRHENIGEGTIGSQGLGYLINHPKLIDKPLILEVPGYNKTGPDKQNIDKLKKLCQ